MSEVTIAIDFNKILITFALLYPPVVDNQTWHRDSNGNYFTPHFLSRNSNSFNNTVSLQPNQPRRAREANTFSLHRFTVSQYDFGEIGSSACTAICLSVISYLLSSNLSFEINFSEMEQSIYASVDALIQHGGSQRHSAVDELHFLIPNSIQIMNNPPFQGLLSNQRTHFKNAFDAARTESHNNTHYIGIIITKPPETVCVLLPPIQLSTNTVPLPYYLFDPHCRPQLGLDTAYLVSSTSEEDIIDRLDCLLPPLPPDVFNGGGVGYGEDNNWGAMMYNMFECTFLQQR